MANFNVNVDFQWGEMRTREAEKCESSENCVNITSPLLLSPRQLVHPQHLRWLNNIYFFILAGRLSDIRSDVITWWRSPLERESSRTEGAAVTESRERKYADRLSKYFVILPSSHILPLVITTMMTAMLCVRVAGALHNRKQQKFIAVMKFDFINELSDENLINSNV